MRFRIPLERRRRIAARRNERYRVDPDYRLRIINVQREKRGLPLLASLDGVSLSRPVDHRARDERGRFA